jgi:hypothetical protein
VSFCQALLPSHVRGRLGTEEPVLAYMLRHTQLLPRHLIDIFNGTLCQSTNRTNGASSGGARLRNTNSHRHHPGLRA